MPVLLDYAPPEFSEATATAVDGSRYFHAPRPAKVERRPASVPGLVILSDDPVRDVGSAARAVLSRDASPDLVAAATRLAAAGYFIRKHEAVAEEPVLRPHFEPAGALTQREMQVLTLLADGASNKVIARKLDISVHTAKFHVASVTAKLRARNRTDAISIALREGVLVA
jgi:DNA-binding NarL/FixJ family response regulator